MIVSPIFASETVLILANINPASPAVSSSQGIGLGDWNPKTLHFVDASVRPETDLLTFAQASVHNAREDDHAAIGIEPGIEDQRPQRSIGVALGRRNASHHRFQHVS